MVEVIKKIAIDGIAYDVAGGGSTPAGEDNRMEYLTQEEYNALSPEQKADTSVNYVIIGEGESGSIDAKDVSFTAEMSTIISDNVHDAIEEVFTNVSNGKELLADAITDKGVETSADDTFQEMAEKIGEIDTNSALNSANGAFISEAYYSGGSGAVNFATFGINDFNGGIGSIAGNRSDSGYTSCVMAITDSNGTVIHSERNIDISTGNTVKSYIYDGDDTKIYFYCGPKIGDGVLFCMVDTTTNSIDFNPTTPTGTKEQITTTITNVSYKIGNRTIDSSYSRDIILLLQKIK